MPVRRLSNFVWNKVFLRFRVSCIILDSWVGQYTMFYEILLEDRRQIKSIKTELEDADLFVKPIYKEGNYSVIRTRIDNKGNQFFVKNELNVREYEDEKALVEKTKELPIEIFSKKFLKGKVNDSTFELLLAQLPLRYTIYPPVVLFNNSHKRSYLSESWSNFFNNNAGKIQDEYFGAMLKELFPNATHIAINKPIIEQDVLRRPFHIYPLYNTMIQPSLDLNKDETWDKPTSEDFEKVIWCHTIQNNIHQFWSPVFTMFSRGNITEKARILNSYPDIENNDVVDLYSGIGYFTLSYLKRGARRVYGFELNPWSVEGLKRGIAKNKFPIDSCKVFNANNEIAVDVLKREYPDRKSLRLRHINLGLLPSSAQGYPIAMTLAEYQQGCEVTTLHIHENVARAALDDGSFSQDTLSKLKQLAPTFHLQATHVEKIKTFAPDVWHVCLDVDVRR